MKKYSILALVLVLTALSLAGCRNPGMNTEPTTVPTTSMTTPPTAMPTTEATMAPTETTAAATEESNPGTIPGDADSGSTRHTDSTGTTDATGEGRSRRMTQSH